VYLLTSKKRRGSVKVEVNSGLKKIIREMTKKNKRKKELITKTAFMRKKMDTK